jgi:hypothetical protein
MSLAACAAAYSLTGTLASESATAIPTATGSGSSSGSAPITSAPPVIPTTTGVGSLSPTSVMTNGTITFATPTTSKISQFTGAANANGVAGGLLVLGVAGVFAAL